MNRWMWSTWAAGKPSLPVSERRGSKRTHWLLPISSTLLPSPQLYAAHRSFCHCSFSKLLSVCFILFHFAPQSFLCCVLLSHLCRSLEDLEEVILLVILSPVCLLDQPLDQQRQHHRGTRPSGDSDPFSRVGALAQAQSSSQADTNALWI